MLQEAAEPTRTFDPHDPKTPRIGKSKLVRLWRIVPKQVAAIERADGSTGVMVLPAGFSLVPKEAQGDWTVNHTERGIKVYFGRDLSALLHAVPKWHQEFVTVTGHHVGVAMKDLPHWYRSNLLAGDKIAIQSVFEAKAALEALGWKEVKHKSWGEAWKKVFAGTAILILDPGTFATELRMVPMTLPPMSGEEWEQAKAELVIMVPVKGRHASELEKAAQELAARAKKWRPKKAHDPSGVRWGGQEGKAALDLWKVDAEEAVVRWLGALRRHGRSQGHTTKALVDLVLSEERPHSTDTLADAEGITRRQMGRMIVAILERLAKAGKVEKETGGKVVLWYPRED